LIFQLQNSIGQSFGRQDGQRWSREEEETLAVVSRRSGAFDEWQLVRCFKDSIPKDRLRFEGCSTVKATLEHWTEILDKSKTNYEPTQRSRIAGDRSGENPRNIGITKGPTDYAAAFARKRQRAEAESLARQVAENKSSEKPATTGTASPSA
jgi:hypothetical protein